MPSAPGSSPSGTASCPAKRLGPCKAPCASLRLSPSPDRAPVSTLQTVSSQEAEFCPQGLIPELGDGQKRGKETKWGDCRRCRERPRGVSRSGWGGVSTGCSDQQASWA